MEENHPFSEVYSKKRYKTGQKSLTPSQVQEFLLHVTDLNHLGLFQLALTAGIRREDIVHIKLKDVDFTKNTVTFYESKKRRIKVVPIPQLVANTLNMIANINKKETYLFAGSSDKLHGKGHLSGRTAYNLFQNYLKKAGIDPRPFHSLRATCIKLCQSKGWSMEQTADLVGDTIEVIQGHYTTPSEEEMREVVDKKPII
jgi:integrase